MRSMDILYVEKGKLRAFFIYVKKKPSARKKDWEIAQPEQKAVKHIDIVANRTLSSERTPVSAVAGNYN